MVRAIIIRVSGVRVPPPSLGAAWKSGHLWVRQEVAPTTWYQFGPEHRPRFARTSEWMGVPLEVGHGEHATRERSRLPPPRDARRRLLREVPAARRPPGR